MGSSEQRDRGIVNDFNEFRDLREALACCALPIQQKQSAAAAKTAEPIDNIGLLGFSLLAR